MTSPIKRVLVVGAGTMGRGVAKSFADGGFETFVWSRRGPSVPGLPPGVKASATPPAEVPDLVVENVPEEVAVKCETYRALEAAYPPSVIIATNTSGLSLDELARGLAHPERFLGAHYFQPADVFPMVEVIAATATAPEVVAHTAEAMRRTGKEPILVRKPVEGYLINRLQHALLNEAYHLIEIGAATPKEIDDIAKHLLGPRMCVTGAIEQKDISGLKIHATAQVALVPKLAHTGKPVRFVQDMVARGETGLKSGRGFYDWRECDAEAVAAQASERLKRVLAFLARELGPDRPGTLPKGRKLGA
ncbi:MAG TPA: 3-hydroxyacyl-CoA dehydrogenase NAD-binding domain-containing protein [Alphaproteobacteria bacterium]|nr:3-hydroxyacyl-CoA dehydrogenase NAD-binding domain-containing protein [Alphaproteobacteria bacterium]